MKRFLPILLLSISLLSSAQVTFDDFFSNKTFRLDLAFAGNSSEISVYPLEMKEEPFYAGSQTNLIDKFNYGNIRYEVTDIATETLIFSRGYGTLFQEWQTTSEAEKKDRSFYEVIKFPFPKNRAQITVKKFEKDGSYSTIYETIIDPANYFIRKEPPVKVKTSRLAGTGDPQSSVDLAFIAEGYTADEMEKFRSDVLRFAEILFETAPFDKYSKKINIWAVESISQDSGTDIPGEEIYLNTALNSSFYTFDLDRYLTTFDIKVVNDYAAAVPHDNIIVLVNSERYGGGGMYNYYNCTTSDHILSPKVFTHEFGHGFAALADEYYSSTVAYDEFYPLSIEPWEANITTLVDFERKWKSRIKKSVPIPTPSTEEYNGVLGLYEGGGYSAKGIYRPQIDCRMKSNEAEGFCAVCQEAIKEMIEYYTK